MDMIFKFLDPVIDLIFKPIIAPFGAIGDVFLFIIQFIFWIIYFIIWFVFFIIWVFSDLLNPAKLITDFWASIILIVATLFSTVMNLIMGIGALLTNSIGSWITGVWGWDQSNITKNDANSNYFQKFNTKKSKKCYLTNDNKVPFSIILGTILCPPIGVFMDLGITGWFNIFVCALLTLLFYLPGLFYALLVIYS